ncbi:DNA-3-methyladenine glycosylase I [Amycolatopsis sp. H20-H5]|uniref:DNA-3-methyladenine glycosylase I n=1 Tax=Amycolatopsis sp. H20-H5 TaxID=3046309 RepID=UPI002DB6804D|nr:DNA-3-methyladenine glycosylase I [Amycolatopsis sp. H20-H5]MEC3979728.1 DNA-3-methyladenine glycosylase I [Amycolatopsis sp. H20-H5]
MSLVGADGVARCSWGNSTPDYAEYHDTEWGVPLHGRDALYERLCLEAFQAGLSWITILRKRESFRAAFAGFVVEEVAGFGEDDVLRLMGDAGIVRNRMKIDAAVGNARVILGLEESLDELLWGFAPVKHRRPRGMADVPAITDESAAMAKRLKKLGFRFLGPTTCYALMQATGMVDDHVRGCFRAFLV